MPSSSVFFSIDVVGPLQDDSKHAKNVFGKKSLNVPTTKLFILFQEIGFFMIRFGFPL